ncbi:uncharacterized protein [Apostichopus japonicus]|uniref:uncharacterized protein isoform X2 n=1 Tax=Stichopus japonicus TaxID=307972 RepID=UPI003AB2BCAC
MSDNEFVGGGKDLQGHGNVLVRLGNTEFNPNSFDFPKSCQHPDSKNFSHVAADLSILPNDFSQSCDQTQINQERSRSNLSTLERGNPKSDITSYLNEIALEKEQDVARTQEVLVPSKEEAGTHNTRPRTPVATPRRSLEKSKSLHYNKTETIPPREITKSLSLNRITLKKIQHVQRTPSIGVPENKTGQTSTSTKSPVSAPRPSMTIAEVPHHDTLLIFPKEVAKPTHPGGIALEKKQDLSKTSEIVLPEENTESTSTSTKSHVSAPRPSMTIAVVPHHDTILTFPKEVAKPTHPGGIALEKKQDLSKTSKIVLSEENTGSTSTSKKSPVSAPRRNMTITEVPHHDTTPTFRPKEITKPTHSGSIALEKKQDLSKTSEFVVYVENTESTSTSAKSHVSAPHQNMTIAEVPHHDTILTFPKEVAKPTHPGGIALEKKQDLSKTSKIVLSGENTESTSTSKKSPVAAPRRNMTITEVPHHDTTPTFRPKEINKPTHSGSIALEKKQNLSKTSELVVPEENTESTSTSTISHVSAPRPSMTIAEVPHHDTILTFPKEVAKPTHPGGIALEKKQDLSKTSEIVLPEENTESTSTSPKSPVSAPFPSMTIAEAPDHDTILTFCPKEIVEPTYPGGIVPEKKQDLSKTSELVLTEKKSESTSTSSKSPVSAPRPSMTIAEKTHDDTLLTFSKVAKPTQPGGIALEKKQDPSQTSEFVLTEENSESTSTSTKSHVSAPRPSMTIAVVPHHDTILTFPKEVAKPTHPGGIALEKKQDLSKTSKIVLSEENTGSTSTSKKSPVSAPRRNMTITEVPHHDTTPTFRPKEITKPTHSGSIALEKKQDLSKTSEFVVYVENTESTSTSAKSHVSAPHQNMTIAEVPHHDTILTFPKEVAKPTHPGGIALEKKQDLSKTSKIVLSGENTESTSTSKKSPVAAPRRNMTITEVPHHDTTPTFRPKEINKPTHSGSIALEKKQNLSKTSELVVPEENTESTSTSTISHVSAPRPSMTIAEVPHHDTILTFPKEVAKPTHPGGIALEKKQDLSKTSEIVLPEENTESTSTSPKSPVSAPFPSMTIAEAPDHDTILTFCPKEIVEPTYPGGIVPEKKQDLSKTSELVLTEKKSESTSTSSKSPVSAPRPSMTIAEKTHDDTLLTFSKVAKPTQPGGIALEKKQDPSQTSEFVLTEENSESTSTSAKSPVSAPRPSMTIPEVPHHDTLLTFPKEVAKPTHPGGIALERKQDLSKTSKIVLSEENTESTGTIPNSPVSAPRPSMTIPEVPHHDTLLTFPKEVAKPTHPGGIALEKKQDLSKTSEIVLSGENTESTSTSTKSHVPFPHNTFTIISTPNVGTLTQKSEDGLPQTSVNIENTKRTMSTHLTYPQVISSQPLPSRLQEEELGVASVQEEPKMQDKNVKQANKISPLIPSRIAPPPPPNINQNSNSHQPKKPADCLGNRIVLGSDDVSKAATLNIRNFQRTAQRSTERIPTKRNYANQEPTHGMYFSLRKPTPHENYHKEFQRENSLEDDIATQIRPQQTFQTFGKKSSSQNEHSLLCPNDEITKVSPEHQQQPKLPPRITSRSQSLNRDKLQTPPQTVETFDKKESHQLSKSDILSPRHDEIRKVSQEHELPPELPIKIISRGQFLNQNQLQNSSPVIQQNSVTGGSVLQRQPELEKHVNRHMMITRAHPKTLAAAQNISPLRDTEQNRDHFYEVIPSSHGQLLFNEKQMGNAESSKKVRSINLEGSQLQEHELPPELPPRIMSRSQSLNQDQWQESSSVIQQKSAKGTSLIERQVEVEKHIQKHTMPSGTQPTLLAGASHVSPQNDIKEKASLSDDSSTSSLRKTKPKSPNQSHKILSLAKAISIPVRSPKTVETFDKKESRLDERTKIFPKLSQPVTMSPRHEQIRKVFQEHKLPPELPRRILSRSQTLNQNQLPNSSPVNLQTSIKGGSVLERQPKLEVTPGAKPTPIAGASQVSPQNNIKGKASLSEDSSTSTLRKLESKSPKQSHNISMLAQAISIPVRSPQTVETFDKKESRLDERTKIFPKLLQPVTMSLRHKQIRKVSQEHKLPPELLRRILSKSKTLNQNHLSNSSPAVQHTSITGGSVLERQPKLDMPPGAQPTPLAGASQVLPQNSIKGKPSLSEDSSTSTLRKPESKSPKQSNKISLLAQAISIPVRSPQTFKPFDKKESRLDEKSKKSHQLSKTDILSPRHDEIRKVSQEHELPPELPPREISRSQLLNQDKLQNSSQVIPQNSIAEGSVLERLPELKKHDIRHIMPTGAHPKTLAVAQDIPPLRDTEQNRDHFYEVIPSSHGQLAFNEKQMGNAENSEKVRPINLEARTVEEVHDHAQRAHELQNNTYKANQLAKSLRKHKQFFQKKRDGRSLLEATIEEIEKRWNENKKKEIVRKLLKEILTPEAIDTFLFLRYELHYKLSDCFEAVESSDGDALAAMGFFQECSICYEVTIMSKITGNPNCQCHVCIGCFTQHFSLLAQTTPCMYKFVCPSCELPDLETCSEEEFHDYFSMLGILLKLHLSSSDCELYHQKLVSWKLMTIPTFRWCANGCGNGFINERNTKKIQCSNCGKYQCFGCNKPWLKQHEGTTCEAFENWKQKNDPAFQAQGLAAHLRENGINCPRCKMRYELAKGGCMHFKCSQCMHEFCCGCNLPFLKFLKCPKISCVGRGLHAHHPRNCLYYLRDKKCATLHKLLKHPEDKGCPVKEQQESPNGLVDANCGRPLEDKTGLCEIHYKEYLVSLINKYNIDPADILTTTELGADLKRNERPVPTLVSGETAEMYCKRLRKLLKKEVPLWRLSDVTT